MIYRKGKKFLLIFIVFMFAIIFTGCKDKETEDGEEKEIEKISASHTIIDDDLNIYLLYQAKPVTKEGSVVAEQSITIYSDFLKGDRTSRHYSYYQVDYQYGDNNDTYYHIFDFVTDGTERSYAQNFLPFNEFSKMFEKISVLFEYSYMVTGSETVFEKK